MVATLLVIIRSRTDWSGSVMPGTLQTRGGTIAVASTTIGCSCANGSLGCFCSAAVGATHHILAAIMTATIAALILARLPRLQNRPASARSDPLLAPRFGYAWPGSRSAHPAGPTL